MSRINAFNQALKVSSVGRWYYGRERQEQIIISALGLLIFASLLWAGVWKPVSDWQTVAQNRQQNAEQLIYWLRANEQAAIQASKSNGQSSGSRALIPLITRAAQAHDLKLNRLQPESNGVISIVLQQQSFNQIMQWIAQLQENNNISVKRASFDSQDAAGYVNAQLRLE